MEKMNKEEFVNELKKIGVNLTEKQLEQLEIYCNELIKYNKHTNLTAIKEAITPKTIPKIMLVNSFGEACS